MLNFKAQAFIRVTCTCFALAPTMTKTPLNIQKKSVKFALSWLIVCNLLLFDPYQNGNGARWREAEMT